MDRLDEASDDEYERLVNGMVAHAATVEYELGGLTSGNGHRSSETLVSARSASPRVLASVPGSRAPSSALREVRSAASIPSAVSQARTTAPSTSLRSSSSSSTSRRSGNAASIDSATSSSSRQQGAVGAATRQESSSAGSGQSRADVPPASPQVSHFLTESLSSSSSTAATAQGRGRGTRSTQPTPPDHRTLQAYQNWVVILERDAFASISELLDTDLRIETILRALELRIDKAYTSGKLKDHLKVAHKMLDNELVRKGIGAWASRCYKQLDDADRDVLSPRIAPPIARLLGGSGSTKGDLGHAFGGIYPPGQAQNSLAIRRSNMSKRGPTSYNFLRRFPSFLCDFVVLSLVLYSHHFYLRQEVGPLQVRPDLHGPAKEWLTWLAKELEAAVLAWQNGTIESAGSRAHYKSFEMGDVVARVAEVIVNEVEERCADIQRMLNDPRSASVSNTATHALSAAQHQSMYGILADVVNDEAFVVEPTFPLSESGIDPSRAPSSDACKLTAATAQRLLTKMKHDYRAALASAAYSGMNDADPFSYAALQGASLREKSALPGNEGSNEDEEDAVDSEAELADREDTGDYSTFLEGNAERQVVEEGRQFRRSLERNCSLNIYAVIYVVRIAQRAPALMNLLGQHDAGNVRPASVTSRQGDESDEGNGRNMNNDDDDDDSDRGNGSAENPGENGAVTDTEADVDLSRDGGDSRRPPRVRTTRSPRSNVRRVRSTTTPTSATSQTPSTPLDRLLAHGVPAEDIEFRKTVYADRKQIEEEERAYKRKREEDEIEYRREMDAKAFRLRKELHTIESRRVEAESRRVEAESRRVEADLLKAETEALMTRLAFLRSECASTDDAREQAKLNQVIQEYKNRFLAEIMK